MLEGRQRDLVIAALVVTATSALGERAQLVTVARVLGVEQLEQLVFQRYV